MRGLCGGIFLTSSFYATQNADAQKDYCADDNPMRRHVDQVRAVNQSDDEDCEADCVDSE